MKETAKTIQIFLPDGFPRSVKIADITSRITQAILIPRNKLREADNRTEIKNVGVYFLFGEVDEKAKPMVYIGEAEDCYIRLKQHNQNKDFWNVAIVIVSKTNSFTKTHGKYLEWYCVKKAKEIERYELDNGSIPSKPFITEPMEADLLDIFETIKILLSTLGFPLFEEIKKPKNLLYCKSKNAEAEGEYIADGFVVFKGSKASLEEVKSVRDYEKNIRKKLIENGILKEEENFYIFDSNHIFGSPSAAAIAVLGRSANGWIEWKNKDGKTLDELKRKN